MITVTKKPKGKRVISTPVTEFTSVMGYCEHKIPFFQEGITQPPSRATILGTKAHHQAAMEEEELGVLVPVTDEQVMDTAEDIEFQREKVYTRLEIPVELEQDQVQVMLNGRADKVYRRGETLVVHDDKTTTKPSGYANMSEPYRDQKLQVLAYLNSLYSTSGKGKEDWFNIPHRSKQWRVVIKLHGKEDPFKVFEGTQSEDDLAYLHYSIDRFAKLILGIEEKKHHNSANRCSPCGFANECKFVVRKGQ